ncbi:MAG: leucine-rich repeat domain-containing protein [Eubacterium sp.]
MMIKKSGISIKILITLLMTAFCVWMPLFSHCNIMADEGIDALPEFIIDSDGILTDYTGDPEDITVTEVEIPWEVTEISEDVFKNYKYIQKVTFATNSKCIKIGKKAFMGCEALNSIELPQNLQSIGYLAFNKTYALKSITIPATVTYANTIFGVRTGVETVTFGKGMSAIPDKVLKGTKSVTKVKMYSGVTSIGKYAFYGCEGIKELTLKKSIKSIGNKAFQNCNNLVLYVYNNSTAKTYARNNSIPYKYTKEDLERQSLQKQIYNNFLSKTSTAAKYSFKLYGLSDYIPQGVCTIGKYVVISAYYPKLNKCSRLYLYNRKTGKLTKVLILNSKDHVGSVTNVKGKLVIGLNNYISGTNDAVGVISYSRLKSAKDGSTIKYNYIVKLSGAADFATYDGTCFWAGSSVNRAYNVKMYGYEVGKKKGRLTFTKKYTALVPENTQGIYMEKGTETNTKNIFISQSYGRNANSSILIYEDIIFNKDDVINLCSGYKTAELPPMAEGICKAPCDKLYIVFESGAAYYCKNIDNYCENPINRMCVIKMSRLRAMSK